MRTRAAGAAVGFLSNFIGLMPLTVSRFPLPPLAFSSSSSSILFEKEEGRGREPSPTRDKNLELIEGAPSDLFSEEEEEEEEEGDDDDDISSPAPTPPNTLLDEELFICLRLEASLDNRGLLFRDFVGPNSLSSSFFASACTDVDVDDSSPLLLLVAASRPPRALICVPKRVDCIDSNFLERDGETIGLEPWKEEEEEEEEEEVPPNERPKGRSLNIFADDDDEGEKSSSSKCRVICCVDVIVRPVPSIESEEVGALDGDFGPIFSLEAPDRDFLIFSSSSASCLSSASCSSFESLIRPCCTARRFILSKAFLFVSKNSSSFAAANDFLLRIVTMRHDRPTAPKRTRAPAKPPQSAPHPSGEMGGGGEGEGEGKRSNRSTDLVRRMERGGGMFAARAVL